LEEKGRGLNERKKNLKREKRAGERERAESGRGERKRKEKG
jgi:hypothetical protein